MDQVKTKLNKLLQKHVPENAVHYCLDLWLAMPFHFKVTRTRNSKLGDYRHDRRTASHSISINHELNPYSFVITYIHEVAHLLTTTRKQGKVAPHGVEWQANFKELMLPILSDLVFPGEILAPLSKHMKKPKATFYTDAKLVQALRKYDEHESELMPLSLLNEGDKFVFNRRMFTKLSLRRTRVLCQEADSPKKYLISKLALVRSLTD